MGPVDRDDSAKWLEASDLFNYHFPKFLSELLDDALGGTANTELAEFGELLGWLGGTQAVGEMMVAEQDPKKLRTAAKAATKAKKAETAKWLERVAGDWTQIRAWIEGVVMYKKGGWSYVSEHEKRVAAGKEKRAVAGELHGMISLHPKLVETLEAGGWTWLIDQTEAKDFMHFEDRKAFEAIKKKDEGADRNRTGVNGFAGRCVATPPRRRGRAHPRARPAGSVRRPSPAPKSGSTGGRPSGSASIRARSSSESAKSNTSKFSTPALVAGGLGDGGDGRLVEQPAQGDLAGGLAVRRADLREGRVAGHAAVGERRVGGDEQVALARELEHPSWPRNGWYSTWSQNTGACSSACASSPAGKLETPRLRILPASRSSTSAASVSLERHVRRRASAAAAGRGSRCAGRAASPRRPP